MTGFFNHLPPTTPMPSHDADSAKATRPRGFFRRVADLYIGGFREMTVGRKLWILIIIKLAVIFLVFRLFFFPDTLKEDYDNDNERARAVRSSLTTPR